MLHPSCTTPRRTLVKISQADEGAIVHQHNIYLPCHRSTINQQDELRKQTQMTQTMRRAKTALHIEPHVHKQHAIVKYKGKHQQPAQATSSAACSALLLLLEQHKQHDTQ
jgi:hypothetical protein